jgi:transposase
MAHECLEKRGLTDKRRGRFRGASSSINSASASSRSSSRSCSLGSHSRVRERSKQQVQRLCSEARLRRGTHVPPRVHARERGGPEAALSTVRGDSQVQPAHRFEFTFTPKHGSWLNLVEGFFSKLARSVLRHIRVASKQELKDRISIGGEFRCIARRPCADRRTRIPRCAERREAAGKRNPAGRGSQGDAEAGRKSSARSSCGGESARGMMQPGIFPMRGRRNSGR